MRDITIRRPINWLCSAESDVGVVRTINEDSVLSKPEIKLWVVADGMGGHEAGNVASNMIVSSLNSIEPQAHLNDIVNSIENKIMDANQRLLEYSEIMLDGRIVGSTVAVLLIQGRVGVCMWAGDSRLYRYRNGVLEPLTHDHSHVCELLRQGLITEEEAVNHPDSNVITRAVGTCEDLYVDIDVFSVQLGDLFLLCSDGLYNSIADDDIICCLQDDDVEKAISNLIELSLFNEAADNVSAVVVKGTPQNDG